MSLGFLRLWTVDLEPSTAVGHSGHVQDVPELPRTLGWDGEKCNHLDWDAWVMSGMSLGFLGLWDGMNSGIGAI